MGILDDVKDAEVTARTPYFPPDDVFEVTIVRTKLVKGRQGMNYIVEARVNSSANGTAPPGQLRCQVMTLEDKYGYGKRDLKSFICNMMGVNPADQDADDQVNEMNDGEGGIGEVAQYFVDNSPEPNDSSGDGLGIPATLETWTHISQDSKTEITKHRWEPREV